MLAEDLLSNESNEKVLKALAAQQSAAFLELISLSGLDDNEVRETLAQFEDQGIVTISNSNDVFHEVVTLKDKGFALAKLLAEKKRSALTHSSAHSLA